MTIQEENKRLKELCRMIYNSDTARWWMRYEINKQFPELIHDIHKEPTLKHMDLWVIPKDAFTK